MKDAGVQFHEGVPATFHLQKWFKKGGLLVLDDLMVEGGEDKQLLDFHIIKISPCCTCARTCFHQEKMLRAFPGMPTTSQPSKIFDIN